MGLDIATIRQLMEESRQIDARDPRQLLDAALKLIYPTVAPATPPTPPMYTQAILVDEETELREQHELDVHVLELVLKTWNLLSTAIQLTHNPEISAACKREQALLILRLLSAKWHLYSLNDRMLAVVQIYLTKHRFTREYALHLLNSAANEGDLIAQIVSIRQLLALTVKPSKELSKTAKSRHECFSTWLNNHPDHERSLKKFSFELKRATKPIRSDFVQALKRLSTVFLSDNFTALYANQNLFVVLKTNMPTLCQIDHAFRETWNQILYIPVATRMKRTKMAFCALALDRSNSLPHSSIPQRFFLERNRSEPKPTKADLETNKRKPNPRDYILQAPKQAHDVEEAPQKSRRT